MNTNSVIPFNFHSREVRIVIRNGDPWFIASDVALALGYRDAANAARNVGDHQKADTQIVSISSNRTEQSRTVTLISEGGLYRLVLRSRKPEAVAFSDWVTDEVLPSIRKTGSYNQGKDGLADIPDLAKCRKALVQAHNDFCDWGYAAHQAMLSAGITPPPSPDVTPDMMLATLGGLLMNTSWILRVNHEFRISLIPVSDSESIVSNEKIAGYISDSSFPSRHLPDIAKAAIDRMSKSLPGVQTQ